MIHLFDLTIHLPALLIGIVIAGASLLAIGLFFRPRRKAARGFPVDDVSSRL